MPALLSLIQFFGIRSCNWELLPWTGLAYPSWPLDAPGKGSPFLAARLSWLLCIPVSFGFAFWSALFLAPTTDLLHLLNPAYSHSSDSLSPL